MAEVNFGIMSGVVDGALERRDGDWGNSVELPLRVFEREYTTAEGENRRVEFNFKLDCATRGNKPNPVYDKVLTLEPGDWVMLKFKPYQRQWNDKATGEPKSWDKREIVEVMTVVKGSQPANPAAVSSDPAVEPPLPF